MAKFAIYTAIALLAGCTDGRAVVGQDTDMLALCNPYGGIAKVVAKSENVMATKRTSSVTIECGDGSWISRSVESRS